MEGADPNGYHVECGALALYRLRGVRRNAGAGSRLFPEIIARPILLRRDLRR